MKAEYMYRSSVPYRPVELQPKLAASPVYFRMTVLPAKELLIKGIRQDGSTFRPSDWAERLCGVAAILHAEPMMSQSAHHAARPRFIYSSYLQPAIICNVVCVITDLRIREMEPRAWDYVTGFARNNGLIMLEVLSSRRETERPR